MTANPPDDPDRRNAEELRRRERRRQETEPASDPALIKAQLDAQKDAIAAIVGEAENQLAGQIAKLVRAHGTLAETLKREIAALASRLVEAKEGQVAGDLKRLESALARCERLLKTLQEGLPAMEKRLVASLDEREGAVFSGIDDVAGKVAPGAGALVAISERMEAGEKAVAGVLGMTPLLESVDARLKVTNRRDGHVRRFGLAVLVLVVLLSGLAGVALQRGTGIWPPDADSDTWWRMHLWERYGQDLKGCVLEARAKEQNMMCPIFDMNP
ncbi:MAG: hypothetical protein OXI95_05185 [bacterium]|nr:hypothetical protein [bacterium]